MKQLTLKKYFNKWRALFRQNKCIETSVGSGNMYQQIACQRWENALNKINATGHTPTTTQLSFLL